MLDNSWFAVTITNMSHEKLNEIRRWLVEFDHSLSEDVFYRAGGITIGSGGDITDEFNFRDANIATLFKLTFGGS